MKLSSETRAKLERAKAKIKQHAPELIIAGLTVFGAAGWIVAGLKEQRIRDLETVDPDAWPLIKIPPRAYEDVENGATLKYRQYREDDNTLVHQMTTAKEFSAVADREFHKYRDDSIFGVELEEE